METRSRNVFKKVRHPRLLSPLLKPHPNVVLGLGLDILPPPLRSGVGFEPGCFPDARVDYRRQGAKTIKDLEIEAYGYQEVLALWGYGERVPMEKRDLRPIEGLLRQD